MSSRAVPSAASTLLVGLLDASVCLDLVEVARTRVSVHYETGRPDVPVLCVCTPEAVRLPNSIVATSLPTRSAEVRGGVLHDPDARWQLARWWQPPRPRGLAPPSAVPALPGVRAAGEIRPVELVGRGPGLTPDGDDVLAGALVAAHAVADTRLHRWREETRDLVASGRTTAVSRGLLHHALDGWAIPELAAFVSAVCTGDASAAANRLLRVGHSSGAALASGALHVLATHRIAVAAA